MQLGSNNKVVNKLALLLLTLVVLELVLMTDRVDSVKAIKKKILLKKLKKLLPLLALVKPKKKLILVPVPIPMFKNHGAHKHYPHPNGYGQQPTQVQPQPAHMQMMSMDSSTLAPMSFMMIPSTMGVGSSSTSNVDVGFDAMLPPMSSSMASPVPSTATQVNASQQPPNPLQAMTMMPSTMTMTIQSDGSGGSSSAIELSTSTMAANASAPLVLYQRPSSSSTKWAPIQQQQQQVDYGFVDEPSAGATPGGEHYYSSPWAGSSSARLTSPAKVLRGEQARPARQKSPPVAVSLIATTRAPIKSPAVSGRLRLTDSPSAKHSSKIQWRPVQSNELEELVPVGPPQFIPVYQTSNGQLHMSPPTTSGESMASGSLARPASAQSGGSASNQLEHEDEVQTVPNGRAQQYASTNNDSSTQSHLLNGRPGNKNNARNNNETTSKTFRLQLQPPSQSKSRNTLIGGGGGGGY